MQIEINTDKPTILLVKVPDRARALGTEHNTALELMQLYYLNDFMGLRDVKACTDLPAGNWNLIGNAFELTEEQCKELVDLFSVEKKIGGKRLYVSYSSMDLYDTARQSFASLLLANDIHKNNPLQDEWDELCTWGHGGCTMDEYQDAGERSGNWVVLARE